MGLYRLSCAGFGIARVVQYSHRVAHSTEIEAERLQAKTAIKGLEIALAGFQTEYNVPITNRLGFKESKNHPVDEVLLRPLMAVESELNPRKIRFYDPPESKKGKHGLWRDPSGGPQIQMRDPWGGPFRVRSDSDGDGKISNPEAPTASITD